jgi:epoxyqueuosine reductase
MEMRTLASAWQSSKAYPWDPSGLAALPDPTLRAKSPTMQLAPASAKQRIRDHALALGFDAVGFASATLGGEARQRLAEFVAAGLHGDMGWMAETAARRGDPAVLWPEARSVVVLGMNYGPASDPLAALTRRERGTISAYAQGRDYHDLIKSKLKALARWMHETLRAEVKVFVDTAPVMEKPLAQRASLGWQGKHTNLVSTTYGSWLFLGEVFTTLALDSDPAETDHCGSCSRCLDICPTAAFPAPYRLDARRCISYLTIEHKGHIAREFRAAMGNRIYGCDDCLAVCPWNKFASRTGQSDLLPRMELVAPRLAELARLDDASFRQVFSGSPVKRIGRDRFLRNVLIAIGNSGQPALAAVAEERLDEPSPLVRAMAVWALSRLLPPHDFSLRRSRHEPDENDPEVKAEWAA